MADTIRSYRDLKIYQAAFLLQNQIFEISKRWPREEKYALTDQIRRSSRAIGANLAEAWAKRKYPAHFISKLTDVDGEISETCHWISTARGCGCLNEAEHLNWMGRSKKLAECWEP